MSKTYVLRNATNGKVLATRVARANDPWSRGLGLLPRARVAPEEGMWIEHCSAVHTLGMRAAIDLYFLDREQRVVKIVPAVKPNRFAVTCAKSRAVVELGAGPEAGREVALGDRLELE